jgi:hypothetical protein
MDPSHIFLQPSKLQYSGKKLHAGYLKTGRALVACPGTLQASGSCGDIEVCGYTEVSGSVEVFGSIAVVVVGSVGTDVMSPVAGTESVVDTGSEVILAAVVRRVVVRFVIVPEGARFVVIAVDDPSTRPAPTTMDENPDSSPMPSWPSAFRTKPLIPLHTQLSTEAPDT